MNEWKGLLRCPFARERLDSGALAEAAPTQRAVKARVWFQLLGVEFLEYARQKGSPAPLKKTSIETAKSASPNAFLYRGLFSRVRVVPALRALGVSMLRGLHEREIRRKG